MKNEKPIHDQTVTVDQGVCPWCEAVIPLDKIHDMRISQYITCPECSREIDAHPSVELTCIPTVDCNPVEGRKKYQQPAVLEFESKDQARIVRMALEFVFQTDRAKLRSSQVLNTSGTGYLENRIKETQKILDKLKSL